jgi:hypothetical protein
MCTGSPKKFDMSAGIVPFMDPMSKKSLEKLKEIEDKNVGLRQNLVWALQDFSKKNNTKPGLIMPGVKEIKASDKDDPNSDYNNQSKRNNGWWGY